MREDDLRYIHSYLRNLLEEHEKSFKEVCEKRDYGAEWHYLFGKCGAFGLCVDTLETIFPNLKQE